MCGGTQQVEYMVVPFSLVLKDNSKLFQQVGSHIGHDYPMLLVKPNLNEVAERAIYFIMIIGHV